jgi:hypothetical protein
MMDMGDSSQYHRLVSLIRAPNTLRQTIMPPSVVDTKLRTPLAIPTIEQKLPENITLEPISHLDIPQPPNTGALPVNLDRFLQDITGMLGSKEHCLIHPVDLALCSKALRFAIIESR